jgi:hypothetical protein
MRGIIEYLIRSIKDRDYNNKLFAFVVRISDSDPSNDERL